MASHQRTQRIADLIQAELAKLIQLEVKDPRVGMVTVTGVGVARDLAHAKIYFTVHDEAQHKEATLEGLKKAAGFLRSRLAKEVKLRTMPQLHFYYDDTLTRAQRIDDLLKKIDD